MNDRRVTICLAAAACLVAWRPAPALTDTLPIAWSALRPADAAEGPPEGTAIAGKTLSWNLHGKKIALSGYLLPVDREGDIVYEFLLVPLAGMCSHMPAPPPNQIVHVFPAQPYRLAENYEAVTISGTLKPELDKTQLFILDGVRTIETGYSVSKAAVMHTERGAIPAARPAATPWPFLEK